MERYEPILLEIRKKFSSGIEELVKSGIDNLTDALASDPDFKDFSLEEKQEFIYSQTKELKSRLYLLRHISDIKISSLIVCYLPSKDDEPYYSWVKDKARRL